jgi:hypothetical protein
MRVAIATIVIVLAMGLMSAKPNKGERQTKMYPGTCPNGESWYLIDSDSDSVTVGCYDPDYSPDAQ